MHKNKTQMPVLWQIRTTRNTSTLSNVKTTTTDKQVHGVKSESIRDKHEDMQSRTLRSCTNSAHSNWKHDMWMQRQQAIDTDEICYPMKSTAAASSASFKTSSAILHFLSAATILTPEKPLWSNIFLSV